MSKFYTKVMLALTTAALVVSATGCQLTFDDAKTMTNSNVTFSNTGDSENDNINNTNSSQSTVGADNKFKDMKLYFVTGVTEPIALRESDDDKSEVLGQLAQGDGVRLISADSGSFYYVYSETLGKYGYVKMNYLTDEESAVCSGDIYFTSEKTPLYTTASTDANELQSLDKGASIKVIAKTSGDFWYVNIPDTKTYGYVKAVKIVSTKDSSSSSTSSKTTSSKATTSKTTTSSTSYLIGPGSAPSNYSAYYAKVNTGYLALRSEQNASDSNIIGQLYTGDSVYAISESGTYWYCYSPKLGMYGYINANYLTSSKPSSVYYPSSDIYYVTVAKGYLALRTEQNASDYNIIGQLYNGDYVEVLAYYGTYWYVYAPSLNMYGYVNSNYLYN